MLFDSSVRRELWRSFIGTLVVLLTVVLTMVLIRILGQATKGSFAPADVSLVLSYTVIGQLPILIALALFVAVVTVLSRLWRDSEMVVWQASGARQFNFVPPLLRMAWPVLAVVAFSTLVARPWAQSQTQVLKYRFEKRSDMARVSPGQFQTSADGKRVFFIDSHSDGQQTGKNVFMVLTDKGQESVITAREGQLRIDQDLRYLVLSQGERTQTDLATSEKTLSRFETARILVGEVVDPQKLAPEVRSLPTHTLLGVHSKEAHGELNWRFGLVWATLNMVLAGLSLAAGNARRNSNWNLVYALLVFVVYFNLLSLSQNWVSQGKLGWIPGLLLVHGGLTLGALAVLWWRDGALMPGQTVARRAGPSGRLKRAGGAA
ncbi:MAG: LPS export ABC transporter permease LptF [Aquabacterium sp.]|uniref:LPS export ABC transporter permease LptF n=1 Tax=Aquabacterium sp. TaxID=1872578 RepID=UPI0025B7C790|nr:LPS export ABC transporter permease LptF [Aquabacterium sp.]MBI3382631.1 LPS export ABC transporter permease LptF [Aquabacterium sp.]